MQLDISTTLDGFDALAPAWDRLVAASHADTVFSLWEWQKTWWEHLGAGDLWLAAGRDADGALAAIFPCYISIDSAGARRLSLLGCQEVADYLDLIIARGREAEAYAAFIEMLRGAAAPAWDVVELCNVRAGSPTLTILPELARAAGFSARVEQADVCPVIALPATYDEYLASLDKKQRHEIRRKERRASSEAQLDWYVVGAGHNLDAEVDIFLDLHRKSRPAKHAFMHSQMTDFFRAMARAMYAAGRLQLMTLTLDGAPEASLFSFDNGHSIMLYNSGFDPASRRASLSLGNVLIALCIRHAIELGRRSFDFLRGDEEYKYRFGARDTYIYRLTLERGA
jgi:CelD/BcsL family acetyltransferase involved in cellulose biosynthesis